MLEAYARYIQQRAEDGPPPLALNGEQTAELVELLKRAKPQHSST